MTRPASDRPTSGAPEMSVVHRCECGHEQRDHRHDHGVCQERDRFAPCGCDAYRPRVITSPAPAAPVVSSEGEAALALARIIVRSSLGKSVALYVENCESSDWTDALEAAGEILASDWLAAALATARAEVWDQAHDVLCTRGRRCSTHMKPGDRWIYAPAAALSEEQAT